MKEFKSKKVDIEIIKLDDKECKLEVNLNSGNVLEVVKLAQLVDKTGDVKHFINIATLIFGKEGFEIINKLNLEDFSNYMQYILTKYIKPQAESINKGHNFNKNNYEEKKYEVK